MKIIDVREIKIWEAVVFAVTIGMGWGLGEALAKWLAAQI